MVIKLVLKPENELVLPINYNYYVQSMIYRLLQDVPQYSSFLHDCGYHMGALKFRLFTFGPITGHYRVLDKIIKFDGRIELEIRSVSEEFIFILRNALRSRESLWLKGQSVRMINVSMYKKLILPHRIEIRTLSPIVAAKKLENGYTKYYSPADKEFIDNISNNFKKKFNAYYGIEPMEDIEIIANISDIKHVITRYNNTIINAYNAHLIIGGNPQYLQFLYDAGIGAKNAQGFGMFEICG